MSLIQPAISKIGEANVSARTKFMIETIDNLKNNRMKTNLAASAVTSEHMIQMKKTLGSLNIKNLRATEPLRITLRDIRDSDKRGKWWLVGASYRDEDRETPAAVSSGDYDIHAATTKDGDNTTNLLQLAREHRMNTDIRRSIFVTIMSASDYKDAYMCLLKLRLKKSQELEIPGVLTHCACAEKTYNPFYTLIARQLCSDRKLKMAFQFTLWALFKRMGESEDGEGEDEEDGDALDMRAIVNLAKMFGTLVVDGGLRLSILKVIDFFYKIIVSLCVRYLSLIDYRYLI